MAEEEKKEVAAPEAAEPSTSKKNKKINRLPADKITTKIEELENKKMTLSVYYKHLLQRKKELGL